MQMRAPSGPMRYVVDTYRGVGRSISIRCLCVAEGLDLGDHASADTSRHCNSLLQQVDEQVSALIISVRTTP